MIEQYKISKRKQTSAAACLLLLSGCFGDRSTDINLASDPQPFLQNMDYDDGIETSSQTTLPQAPVELLTAYVNTKPNVVMTTVLSVLLALPERFTVIDQKVYADNGQPCQATFSIRQHADKAGLAVSPGVAGTEDDIYNGTLDSTVHMDVDLRNADGIQSPVRLEPNNEASFQNAATQVEALTITACNQYLTDMVIAGK